MTLISEATGDNFNEPLSSDDSSAPSFPSYNKGGALKGTSATSARNGATPFKVKQVKIKSAVLARAIAQSKRARQTRHGSGN